MLTYTSTKWVNGSGSPLNATNLNNIETGIDALVGAVNTHEGALEAHGLSISELTGKIATNETNIKTNSDNIKIIRTDLSTVDTKVGENTSHISALEGTVGNSTTGLVKRVTTLETDSATKVALKSATDRIGNLEATYASDTELLAVDTRLQADIDEVDERLKARIATAEQDIITLKNSTSGGGASTWEDLAGKPSAFTPTAHTDGNATTYGAATESLYGHVKISNGDVHNTAHATGVAAGMDHTHSNYATKEVATTSSDGLFSATDKTKLEGIATGANKTVITNDLTTDSTTTALSASQGKVLKGLIDTLATKAGTGDMSTVVYDTDGDGKVDNANNADKFDGHSVSEFAMVSHNHEQTQVIGLSTALAGKSDVGHTHDYADKAFKSIVVGGATITADDHKDSVELIAGDNVTLSGDATNDKITISATDTTYIFTDHNPTLAWGTKSKVATVGGVAVHVTMPANPDTDSKTTTGAGNTSSKIYIVGATSQATSPTTYTHDTAYVGTDGCLYSDSKKVLTDHQAVTNSAPTLSWGTTSTVGTVGGTALTVTMPANPNTDTHHTAKNIAAASSTATANASATSNAVYFNLIENGAVRSSHKIAGSGSTKVDSDASGNITITTALTGGASTIESTNLTASRALVSNSSGKVAVSAVTSTELGYLDGVTSSVQTQLNTLADMLTWKEF